MLVSTQIQTFLSVEPDGDWGKVTRKAAKELLDSKGVNTDGWNDSRLSIGVQQVMMSSYYNGKIDGFKGPIFNKALEDYQNAQIPVDKSDGPGPASPIVTVKNKWPRQKDVPDFYGDVGENQTSLVLPYPCKISWEPKKTITKFSIHRKCAASAGRVLQAVLDHYGMDEIERLGLNLWSGCLNVRKMRGGNSYSMHSWGIAIDWDAEHNEMRWDHRKARFAKPEYNKWWELWEAEGWTSLGRTRDFDWQHVQAAGL